MQSNRTPELRDYIDEFGIDRVLDTLSVLRPTFSKDAVLTIVANEGVHHMPPELLRGKTHVASSGNLNFSDQKSVLGEYEAILKKLALVLKEKKWKRIYLVPFGHSTLSLQIKLLVFRVTRLETVDIFYTPETGYFDLEIQQRKLIAASSKD